LDTESDAGWCYLIEGGLREDEVEDDVSGAMLDWVMAELPGSDSCDRPGDYGRVDVHLNSLCR